MTTTDAGLGTGAAAPDLQLDGAPLAARWQERPLALVFLHGLETPLAAEVAIQWRDNGSAQIDEAGGGLTAIANAASQDAAAFRERWSLPFDVLGDPSRKAYDAFAVSPELPGSFIVAPDGIVRYAHRNAEPLDNPATWSLIDVISSMTGQTVARPELSALPSEQGSEEMPDGVPKAGQQFGLNFTCVKCGNQTYNVIDVSATSGMLSRMVNLQNRRFSAVVCQRCKYAEFYQTQSGALRNIADLLVGS